MENFWSKIKVINRKKEAQTYDKLINGFDQAMRSVKKTFLL